MSPVTTKELKTIMPRCDAERWVSPVNAAMAEFGLTTPKRQAMFLAQVAHESGELHTLKENLNYSSDGLLRTFPKYFKRMSDATNYARQPEKIANRVYANRPELGNGDEKSGDGWKYRGKGLIQVTGKITQLECLQYLKQDDPDYLLTDVGASRSAAWFFSVYKPKCVTDADAQDIVSCTRRINGGTNGLAERKKYYATACKALGV